MANHFSILALDRDNSFLVIELVFWLTPIFSQEFYLSYPLLPPPEDFPIFYFSLEILWAGGLLKERYSVYKGTVLKSWVTF